MCVECAYVYGSNSPQNNKGQAERKVDEDMKCCVSPSTFTCMHIATYVLSWKNIYVQHIISIHKIIAHVVCYTDINAVHTLPIVVL